jgi:hypothetical protein
MPKFEDLVDRTSDTAAVDEVLASETRDKKVVIKTERFGLDIILG